MRDQVAGSGDNYLAGPQLQASLQNLRSTAVYSDFSDDGPFYDAKALDSLGYDARRSATMSSTSGRRSPATS